MSVIQILQINYHNEFARNRINTIVVHRLVYVTLKLLYFVMCVLSPITHCSRNMGNYLMHPSLTWSMVHGHIQGCMVVLIAASPPPMYVEIRIKIG
jgi:hypothetical protein